MLNNCGYSEALCILLGQTVKQKIAITQTTKDQFICTMTEKSYERKNRIPCISQRLAKEDLMTEFT